MRKINYDELFDDKKLEIRIKGKVYRIPEPTVGDIIRYQNDVKRLQEDYNDANPTVDEISQRWISVVKSIYVTVPEDVLSKLTMTQIHQMTADCTRFVRESLYGYSAENEKVREDEELGEVESKKQKKK